MIVQNSKYNFLLTVTIPYFDCLAITFVALDLNIYSDQNNNLTSTHVV